VDEALRFVPGNQGLIVPVAAAEGLAGLLSRVKELVPKHSVERLS
jgi:hypothetical protein